MTKERNALKLALAALEYHTVQTRPVASTEAALALIKEALAQPSDSVKQETVMEYDKEELRGTFWDTTSPTVPTGWDNGLSQDYNKKLGAWFSEKPNAKQELRETLAQPAQEPVAVVGGNRKGWFYLEGKPAVVIGMSLYANPPKRKEWVELEAEHMDEITHTAISIVDAMLLTETKLKELNK